MGRARSHGQGLPGQAGQVALAACTPAPEYPGAPAGTVLGYETIVSTGVADSTQARP